MTSGHLAEDDREKLRALIARVGFLRASDGETLRSRGGGSLAWLFYGPNLHLTAEGATLGARVVLEKLRSFEARQLATYGQSAIPLLGACVVLGEGSYTGLVVRRERKRYGSCRLIDGPIDTSGPVIVVDESMSSGASIRKAIECLEREGLRVEGAIAVTHFSGHRSKEWFEARGYRVETVFDVWSDLGRRKTVHRAPESPPWDEAQLPDNLEPGAIVRRVVEHYLAHHTVPRPPARVAGTYCTDGGAMVSARDRSTERRHVRAGFRHALVSRGADVAADVVMAAYKAALEVRRRGLDPSSLKLAVTMYGPYERIAPGAIDVQRDGVLVASEDETVLNAALPSTPHYDSGVGQFWYARGNGGYIGPLEQPAVYRHDVLRSVEPGAIWPRMGSSNEAIDPSWLADAGRHLAARVTELVGELWNGRVPAPADSLACPEAVYGVAVTFYDGDVTGCGIAHSARLDECVIRATRAALFDERYPARKRPPETFVVSLLLRRQFLGPLPDRELEHHVSVGRKTLVAVHGDRRGLILPQFAVHGNWDVRHFAARVRQKARLELGERCDWLTFETVSWLARPDGVTLLRAGFPHCDRRIAVDERVVRFADYLSRRRTPETGLHYWHLPSGELAPRVQPSATRILLAALALIEADRIQGSSRGRAVIDDVLQALEVTPRGSLHHPRLGWSRSADALLLRCLCLLGHEDGIARICPTLARRLRFSIHPDGAIFDPDTPRSAGDLDYYSGAALWALATYATLEPTALAGVDLPRIREFYAKRFRLAHPWGMVWWHAYAWSSLSKIDGAADLVFEMLDWALPWQSQTEGWVITDLDREMPSFVTGCVAEALARGVALATGARSQTYTRAWELAMSFLDRLTYDEPDTYWTRDRDLFGGVRERPDRSWVRIDYTAHALLAACGMSTRG